MSEGELPKKDCQRRTAKGGQPKEDYQRRTAKGGLPKEDCRREKEVFLTFFLEFTVTRG